MHQTEIVNLEDLVPQHHVYRKFNNMWSFTSVEKQLSCLVNDNQYKCFGILRLFKCLLLQFMEDLSDRELERFLQDTNSAKWFCGFSISETTPDFTLFSKVRKKIGTSRLSEIFADLRVQLKSKGLMSETFTFVDASHLISKANLWEERDKAIAAKYEKLNNETLPKVAHDVQARIGYANGLANVAPKTGAVYADKGYCTKPCKTIAKIKGLHLAAIKNNNMKDKNKDKDRWYSKIRAPYERVFSQRNKHVRYTGIAKNQFTGFMAAICFNLKRLVVLDIPDLKLT